ncbi:GlsB/YeaQ/YmgE family stress response membrane protein [Tateyamaria sp. ANG-S1]|uniref:GlsB/YeaQ/YmgE family stress response membrane protein n=1 Tax=Tateyamaria sp. ANG-S1 TaxID=1577905 RepID=UPI00057E89B0|nr:GlsB/YeaQ/YmgE family stress response membrane protein [Tateyamaria sp. ANG-S1]KIC49728.1 membrane protein [Tateyamaria sp. ANG-S1]
MTGLGWFAAIIVGALAGWIAEKIMKTDHSLLLNIVLGILGAVVFNAIVTFVFGATLGGWIGQLVAGIVGACILITLGRAVRSA